MTQSINTELVKYAYENLNNLPKGLEYEKMILSVPYNCFSPELVRARTVAHEDALDYGAIRLKHYDYDPEKYAKARLDHLRKIFGSVEDDVFMEAPFYVDYGCNVKIGKHYYGNFNITFLDCTLITLGDNVMCAPNVTFTTATHPTDPQQRLDGVEYAKPITVGNNVWFGAGATILPDVTIGDGVVVGAGAVVNKSIPANAVVVGCPARVIKIMQPSDNKVEVAREVGTVV
ncbi:trimeric LpxA-like protein [Suhomyces tanzawaensis NRRL Y-17324]|uniref:Trimeric LpxA-like protein n=1 Tax=Suhomyces tanzawaensis NRRL Y-17324 TaxID=984487 RepID=A0A1E4SIP8_9ASCO|nr:trimeric LpxA-like protein [Suhomyces tanzawaensis NRRL Y-17324]ODV79386.1 trimeric LpxA-like protein [Suhomyces tanzawaensis NRRL Y-17324]